MSSRVKEMSRLDVLKEIASYIIVMRKTLPGYSFQLGSSSRVMTNSWLYTLFKYSGSFIRI